MLNHIIKQSMKNSISYLLLILSFILHTSCNRSITKSSNSTTDLKMAVNQLVSCLNAKDNACVKELYAADFKSFSPVVKFDNVHQLVDQTIGNLTKNKYKIDIKIHELKEAKGMGYVRLSWVLSELLSDGNREIIHAEQRLDIWIKNKTKQWQLHRSLFYTERSF